MDLTLLTPLGALVALGVVVPLAALALLHRRGESVRRAIGLPEPRPRVLRAAVAALAVASWNSTPPQGTQQQDRSELLLAAVASFEQAIALDPENDDAKYNLQLMLQRGQGLLPTEAAAGRNPSAGGKGSRGAGAGAPGSGY